MKCNVRPKNPDEYRKWRNHIADNKKRSLNMNDVIQKAWKKAGIKTDKEEQQ